MERPIQSASGREKSQSERTRRCLLLRGRSRRSYVFLAGVSSLAVRYERPGAGGTGHITVIVDTVNSSRFPVWP